MKRKRINAVLTVAALALTLLIPTALPLAGTAAPRLERQPLESLTVLNSTETTQGSTPLSAFSVPSAASVVQSPGTTTRISAALPSASVMFIENVGQFADGARFRLYSDHLWQKEEVSAVGSSTAKRGWAASDGTTGFHYPDFSSTAGLNLVGNAAQVNNKLRLTSPQIWQDGAAWYITKQLVQGGFETTFQFSVTELGSEVGGSGADGIVFVVQNSSVSALGGDGQGIGYGTCSGRGTGISNSIAVEFDTWFNSDLNDPNDNHISVQTRGVSPNNPNHTYSLGSTTNIPNLSDTSVHTVKIKYTPGTMQVFLDNLTDPVLAVNLNLSNILSLDKGYAWVGITSATGRAWENHDILNWSFNTSGLPPSPYQTANLGSPSSPTNQTVAEPISVIFGNYTYQHTDLSISGRGLPVGIERTYNSITPSVTSDGPFGYGWTHAYALTTTQETTSTVMVKNEDGRLDRFTDDGAGGYTPPPGTFNTLTKNPDGTFTLTRKDQTQYHFDASGRLASIVDKNGNAVTLTYTDDNLTSITDAVSRTITLTYDTNGHITQIADPAGRTNTYDYDANGNLISHTDARGQTTTYAYDANHRLTSITDANGHTFVQNTYDAEGRVVQQEDALGNVTTFGYDTANRQTTVTDPLGNQTVYTYDADWRATGETDALGYTESYTYDEHNNRTSVTDKNGNTTYYAYDANGNTTVITDTMGYTTTMTYDAQNNLTGKTDAQGRTTTFTYNTNGNLTSTINVSGTTSFAYDGLGQMISTTDANGNTTQFGYNAYGYQTAITDTLGNVTTFTYDIVGRKLSEIDANGNTTAYTYDAHNNLLTVTDALGGATSYTYDDVGNRIGVTNSLSHTTTYTYDEKDRLVSITDAMSNTTTYAYDANDNRIQETDALSHTTVYTYNAVNLLVQVEDPLSNVTTYTYDGNGNRTSVTDANGNATAFTYDALNHLTQVTDPLGHTTTYAYDAVGNKTSVTDANGNTTSYGYDALNRLIQVTDALSGVVTYDYDPVGNKTATTDANGHVTHYEYDPLNRLLRVTDPLSNTTTYGYDAVGNKASLLDANGDTTTYTYDALNRLIQITYPDSSVQYVYDAVGNRTAMTDTTGITTYVYDALDRLTSVTSPDSSHTVSYSYDAVGNRTGITYPDGKEVTYAYDAADRLSTITDWATRVTSYTYDFVGNLTAVSYPNGTEASYSYDDANRLLQLANTRPGGTISSFSYTLDDVGNRTQVVEADGDVITYTYDALYRLTNVWEQMRVDFDIDCDVDVADIMEVASRWRTKDTDPGWDAWYDLDGDGDIDVVDIMLTVVRWGESCESASYTYDAMGNRLSMTIPTGTITYTYDAADRLLNISDGTTFTWDANGNMLSKGTTTYAYDVANRLTQVTSGATTVQFTYDGDSKRVNKTANGTTTRYLYDVNTPLPVVLAETTGGADTLYTYGADLIAMTAPAGAQTYYHYDALGSTRNLSGDTGAVLASYTYGAFGNLRLMKGSSDNTLKFTGEQTDDETGLIYLRARYYDPEVGRFVTKDPFPGFDNDVQSINRYVYVQNNPANLDDPSGKLPNLLFAALGGVAGGTIKAGLYIAEQKIIRHEEVNWRVASGKFASGAFTGATAGFTMGGSLIATGAVKGVISYGIEQVVSGEQATLKEAVASGIIGGVTGGLIGGIERMSGLRIPIFDPHAVPGQLSLFDNTIVVTSREYAKYRIAEILAKTGIQLTLEQIRDAFFIQTRGGLVRPAYTSDLAPHLLPQIDSPVILAPSGGK